MMVASHQALTCKLWELCFIIHNTETKENNQNKKDADLKNSKDFQESDIKSNPIAICDVNCLDGVVLT